MLTYTITDDNILFSWDPIANATRYKLYKRIAEKDVKYTVIYDSDQTKFSDVNIIPEMLYKPEISLVSQRQYGLIKAYIVDDVRNKRTLEYYVECYDVDNNIIAASDKVMIEMFDKPDKYFYLVKRAINDISESDRFTETTSPVIVINSLNNNKYILYVYSQYKNATSEYATVRFTVDNSIFANDEQCDIPNGIRYNNRYRGPQESKKKDNFINITKDNINKLKKIFEHLDEYQYRLYDKTDYINNKTSNKIDETIQSIKDIREALKYGKRNN